MSGIWSEMEVWEIAVFAVLVLLAWSGSWFMTRILCGRMKRAVQARAPVLKIEVLRTLVPLVRWGLLLAAVAVALHMLKLPPAVELWLGRGAQAALALLTAFIAGRAVSAAFLGWAQLPSDPAEARTRGCCKLTLEVLEGNRGALEAYLQSGFRAYALDPAMGTAIFLEKLLD